MIAPGLCFPPASEKPAIWSRCRWVATTAYSLPSQASRIWSAIRRRSTLNFPVPCWRTLKKEDRAMAALDWSQCPAVEGVPARRSGAWVFRDSRMPVATVFENLEVGSSIEEIIEQYDVTDR